MAVIGGIGGGGGALILILLVLAIVVYRKRRRKMYTPTLTMNTRNLSTQVDSFLTTGPLKSSDLDVASKSHQLDDLVAMDRDSLNEHQAPQAPVSRSERRQDRRMSGTRSSSPASEEIKHLSYV